jgi:hypothetical protein
MSLPIYRDPVLNAQEKASIQTAAFCGYIMGMEKCTQEEALQRMARMCTVVQEMAGLGNRRVR